MSPVYFWIFFPDTSTLTESCSVLCGSTHFFGNNKMFPVELNLKCLPYPPMMTHCCISNTFKAATFENLKA